MVAWLLRSTLRTVVGVMVAICLFVSPGKAALSGAELQSYQQQFLANPVAFLTSNFANGGPDLAAVIKAIAANPDNLQTIISALPSANSNQQNAIGSGLGQAAVEAQASNPDYANRIQTAVAAAGLSDVSAGFAAATGGTQIGSTGGDGGGGGGGGGPTGGGSGAPSGGGGGGGGSSGGTGTTQTGTAAQNLLTGGGVGSFGAISGSVSP